MSTGYNYSDLFVLPELSLSFILIVYLTVSIVHFCNSPIFYCIYKLLFNNGIYTIALIVDTLL